MNEKIDLGYYFGEFAPYMFFLIPIFIFILPFLWIYSFFRVLVGCVRLGVDKIKDKVRKVEVEVDSDIYNDAW